MALAVTPVFQMSKKSDDGDDDDDDDHDDAEDLDLLAAAAHAQKEAQEADLQDGTPESSAKASSRSRRKGKEPPSKASTSKEVELSDSDERLGADFSTARKSFWDPTSVISFSDRSSAVSECRDPFSFSFQW